MSTSTGFDLLLLAADLSETTSTVENFEEEFGNTTFLNGASAIVASTPIRNVHNISYADPRPISAMDLSVTMIENEKPLDLTMDSNVNCDVPLNLMMPKIITPIKLSSDTAVNLCMAPTKRKQSLISFTSPVQSSSLHGSPIRKLKNFQNLTFGTFANNFGEAHNEGGSSAKSSQAMQDREVIEHHEQVTQPRLHTLHTEQYQLNDPQQPRQQHNVIEEHQQAIENQTRREQLASHGEQILEGSSISVYGLKTLIDSGRHISGQVNENQEGMTKFATSIQLEEHQQSSNSNPEYGDSDSESEINENATIGFTTHAVSEYFETYVNQTLISTDDSSDENNSISDNSIDTEQNVPVADSLSESSTDALLQDHPNKGSKKRAAWVVRKNRKERGLKYQRTNGTFAPARRIKNSCHCSRLKCHLKYTESLRSDILSNLLKLSSSGQNQFINNHVIVKPVTRTRMIIPRRTWTYVYNLPGLNGQSRVCKKMFLSTLDIGEKKVRWLIMKRATNGGICPDDLRASNRNSNSLTENEINAIKRHIMSFPSSESHYSREKSSKKFLSSDLSVAKMYEMYKEECTMQKTCAVHYNTYRKVFRTMNLSFRKPRVDTCNTCDVLQNRLSLATENEKQAIKEELENHHQNAQRVYNQKRADIERAKSDDDTLTISFDLQKALATPYLNCGEVFYLRQMYTYNLTIFITSKTGNEARCYLWDESKARRGAQEVGSCLWKFLQEMPDKIKVLNCYSDRCFGQNCNTIICSMFAAFATQCLAQKRDITITHNFMVSGHSHMECDSVHSSIERAKKKSSVSIEIPKDWATFISSIRRKVPFKVVEMEQKDFLALKELDKTFKKPTCDTNNVPLKFQKIMCLRYRSTLSGSIEFKYETSDSIWSQFIFAKPDLITVAIPGPINSEPLSLPQAKLDDLRKQMKYVKNKAYYETFMKEIVPKKRGRKAVNHSPDDFEADMDMDLFVEEEINVTINVDEADPLA